MIVMIGSHLRVVCVCGGGGGAGGGEAPPFHLGCGVGGEAPPGEMQVSSRPNHSSPWLTPFQKLARSTVLAAV